VNPVSSHILFQGKNSRSPRGNRRLLPIRLFRVEEFFESATRLKERSYHSSHLTSSHLTPISTDLISSEPSVLGLVSRIRRPVWTISISGRLILL